MTYTEIDLFGVYVAPIAPMIVAAWVLLTFRDSTASQMAILSMRPTRSRGARPRWQGMAWYSPGSHRDIGTMSSFLDARAETAH
jgi:hypothetical protein